MLRQAGYIAMSGQIVDASLVAAPRQRNTDDEKKANKEGRIPANWKAKPAKLRHKDRDARWTVKFTKAKPREDGSTPPVDLAIPLFGYQNHVCMDRPCVASPMCAMEGLVLQFCIRPVGRACGALGHNGYPRASALILEKALRGQ